MADLERGEDRLDRMPLDDAFVEGGFSDGAREVRVSAKGRDAWVRVDADGDGAPDMIIVARGVDVLGAEDFLR